MTIAKLCTGLVAAVGLALSAHAAPADKPPPKPKLVVVISVDQLAYDLYDRYRPSFTDGLKRLGRGASFVGYQAHAATETCPGHSTILTGAHPAHTRIVANSWYDPAARSMVYCVSVPDADRTARGPQNLKATTLGDWLKDASPASRVYAVSGKDRAAIMLAGHKADGAFWWQEDAGFFTSSYAAKTNPDAYQRMFAFDQARFKAWRAKPPQLWPAPRGQCAALQKPEQFGRRAVSGAVPPEDAIAAQKPANYVFTDDFQREFRYSAIFDGVTLDFAAMLIATQKLGRGPASDVLAIGLSATDLIGHRYGNGGAEMCVQMANLDRALGDFLRGLDRQKIPYVVALTADHGAVDAAERLQPPGLRIDTAALIGDLNKALQASFALKAAPIVGDDPRQLWITLPEESDPALKGKVQAAAITWLKARPEVEAAFTAAEVAAAKPAPQAPPATLSLRERFNLSYDGPRNGDVAVAYRERATLGMPVKATDTVAGHGSPWDYDRRVPILMWWPGSAPTFGGAAETVDIAPTLAAMLGVTPPPVDGKPLAVGR